MTTLPSSFEDDLREALLDDVEQGLEELFENFVELVHTRLRSYGRRHGYDVESTIESVSDVQIDRSEGTVTARVGWRDEQMSRWEFGIDPFTMPPKTPTNAEVLSFVWEDPPQWVREEFDRARSSGGEFRSGWRVFLPRTGPADHPGMPESRAIRDSLNGLRRLLRS
jgi:hypothetical protein